MTEIGLPSTLPPKSSTAICAAVTEPWPVGVDAGPDMSVSTPILTTSSETWAEAHVDQSDRAASAPSVDAFLTNIEISSLEFVSYSAATGADVLRACYSSASRKHRTFAGTYWRAGSNACTVSGSQRWPGRMRRSKPAATAAAV